MTNDIYRHFGATKDTQADVGSYITDINFKLNFFKWNLIVSFVYCWFDFLVM